MVLQDHGRRSDVTILVQTFWTRPYFYHNGLVTGCEFDPLVLVLCLFDICVELLMSFHGLPGCFIDRVVSFCESFLTFTRLVLVSFDPLHSEGAWWVFLDEQAFDPPHSEGVL